jgi:phosphoglycolate phosphatase-like HAD superfamily hydrolase
VRPTLLLDLDGTLVDSVPDLLASANRVAATRGLAGFAAPEIDAVGGDDSFPARKPDPAHLLATLEAAGGDPGASVVVGGDSQQSSAMAKTPGTLGLTRPGMVESGPLMSAQRHSSPSGTRNRAKPIVSTGC